MTSTFPVALVTGASSGIGRASARALADRGFTVVGTSRHAAQAQPEPGVELVDLDVTDDASVTSVVADVVARHGRIDVLVNNAGVGSAGAAEESSTVQARGVFDTNVFGVIRMTNAVLPHMRSQRSGRVVNISSIVGLIPMPYMAVYAASKHAVEGYSESIDHEVRELGVRVLLVEPGWTSTAFDTNSVQPDHPLPAYAERRTSFEDYMARAVDDGDAPAAVAAQVVAAATDRAPKLRYPVGPVGRVHTLRRLAPARMFDRQLRKLGNLPA